jgi:hypothetical protein
VAQLKIYNLSAQNRNFLRYDFSNFDPLNQASVELRAGYGDTLAQVFAGNITQAYSVREGTNFITTIESMDGSFAFTNGVSDRTFAAGTPYLNIYKALISDLPGIQLGSISDNYVKDAAGTLFTTSREFVASGNTAALLGELTGGGFFIDKQTAFILGDNFALDSAFTTVDASSGLLNTPILEQNMINFDTIFEPRIQVCQYIRLITSTGTQIGAGAAATSINGSYKVCSVKHRGIISPVVSGDAVTSVGLYAGSAALSIAGFANG